MGSGYLYVVKTPQKVEFANEQLFSFSTHFTQNPRKTKKSSVCLFLGVFYSLFSIVSDNFGNKAVNTMDVYILFFLVFR